MCVNRCASSRSRTLTAALGPLRTLRRQASAFLLRPPHLSDLPRPILPPPPSFPFFATFDIRAFRRSCFAMVHFLLSTRNASTTRFRPFPPGVQLTLRRLPEPNVTLDAPTRRWLETRRPTRLTRLQPLARRVRRVHRPAPTSVVEDGPTSTAERRWPLSSLSS